MPIPCTYILHFTRFKQNYYELFQNTVQINVVFSWRSNTPIKAKNLILINRKSITFNKKFPYSSIIIYSDYYKMFFVIRSRIFQRSGKTIKDSLARKTMFSRK